MGIFNAKIENLECVCKTIQPPSPIIFAIHV